MQINTKLYRSIIIGKQVDKIRQEKEIVFTDIAKKMGLKAYQPIANPIKGKIVGSDSLFKRILKTLQVPDKQIKEIFKEADRQTYIYQYGEDLLSSREFSYEEIFEMIKEKENLTEKQIADVKDYIKFQKRK